jgi:hypothetical protein
MIINQAAQMAAASRNRDGGPVPPATIPNARNLSTRDRGMLDKLFGH